MLFVMAINDFDDNSKANSEFLIIVELLIVNFWKNF